MIQLGNIGDDDEIDDGIYDCGGKRLIFESEFDWVIQFWGFQQTYLSMECKIEVHRHMLATVRGMLCNTGIHSQMMLLQIGWFIRSIVRRENSDRPLSIEGVREGKLKTILMEEILEKVVREKAMEAERRRRQNK